MMSNAKICDMCGSIIQRRGEPVPTARYLITIQKVRLINPETITVDLCPKCFAAICEISRKKNEHKDGEGQEHE